VAHDFNNILTVIQGYSSMLLAGEQSPSQVAASAQQIMQASERAANLTRQLLAFSRRQVMQPRLLDLNEIVTNLAKMLQRILGEDVHLELALHPAPLTTRADAGMLDQVLLNLVVNSRDAMPGGGHLCIETRERFLTVADAASIPDATEGRYVCLRVTDTGTGIPPELRARIFEPFFTTKDQGKGTGLGLATVFGIVKQHGGALTVESAVGEGTTFQIFLPAEDTSIEARADEAAGGKPCGGTETILLVEDEPTVRLLTCTVLEEAGYRVIEAADGPSALRIWEDHRDSIQLLLTDIVMPEGMNGLELAARLRAQNPKLRVIFTSGYSADIAGQELTLQEGQNFVPKPATPQKILQIVRRSLDD
jgi:CheY-like chemotaxis protein